jgi:hypothetical protein
MASLFLGLKSVRMEYKTMLGTDISGATLVAPKLFYTLQRDGRSFGLKNTTDVILRLYIVNPDDESQTKVLWTEIDPGETFGWDMMSSAQQFSIPPQTQIYVTGVTLAGVAANPAAGRLRFTSWG